MRNKIHTDYGLILQNLDRLGFEYLEKSRTYTVSCHQPPSPYIPSVASLVIFNRRHQSIVPNIDIGKPQHLQFSAAGGFRALVDGLPEDCGASSCYA